MTKDKYQRFATLCFEDFRRFANDESLSREERVGFPVCYRTGKEKIIFHDILQKLSLLRRNDKTVLDIGPGCSKLPVMMMDLCRRNRHKLLLVDSGEMLSQLPDKPFVKKIEGYFPYCDSLMSYRGNIDVILSYSVLHYIFAESNVWDFLDASLELLSSGGEMLIGDIPNVSKRRRFFSSPAGVKFHHRFMRTKRPPEVVFNRIERHVLDDSVVLALVTRARNQGCDAYVLPQADGLPMANRREDILIRKP